MPVAGSLGLAATKGDEDEEQWLLITQKVNVKSIPSDISSNASVRVCFKVNDTISHKQILGPGSYANGPQATMFDFVKDKGIAYLKADGPGRSCCIVRSWVGEIVDSGWSDCPGQLVEGSPEP